MHAETVLTGPISPRRSPIYLRAALSFARRKPLGLAGLLLVVVLGLAAMVLPPFTTDPLSFNLGERFQKPHPSAPFGTDDKGRDVLARTVHGARVSLLVGLIASGVGVTFGMVVGLVTGYAGGITDAVGQRLADGFLAFPTLLLAMAVTVALGRSVTNVSLALAVVAWPTAARVIRAAVLTQRFLPYVEAARASGAGTPRIIFQHLLPNIASVYIVIATAMIAQAILAEAALSFLGVGVPPPRPSLGGMVLDAQQYMARAPWIAIFPGIVISLAVFGFNLFGDALRDLLDPRTRRV